MHSQERLQINRATLDNWSTREQLCLAQVASATKTGDQNWIAVSRTLKQICSNEANNRPTDWFSQKSCAIQYSHLLENVETPKRKKRTSEGSTSPIVETPTDAITRRLIEERIQELKAEIRKDQYEFAKIHGELQAIQSADLTEEKLFEMWREIEQQQEAERIEEMKLENQMREREQRQQELQRNWRLGVVPTVSNKQSSENNTIVDMDVEEIIGVGKQIVPSQQPQQQTATSPLLSSLLKTPTATCPPSNSPVPSARTTAPTITTLLTSGSIPNCNQPAITLNSVLIPPEKAVQLLSRPISGPPIPESSSVSTAQGQQLLSPSQSAPTLSMLLERNKTTVASSANQQTMAVSSADVSNSNKLSASMSTESNKEEVPMEIEEAFNVRRNEQQIEQSIDSDEPDPNEEQQLLEVFKNIGNIDELDIDVSAVIDDEEVDFLKGVDEETPTDTGEEVGFDTKLEPGQEQSVETKENIKLLPDAEVKHVSNVQDMTIVTDTQGKSNKTCTEIIIEGTKIKIETSSDDSNDNIPLAAVATLENKERSQTTPTLDAEETSENKSFLKEKMESTFKNINDVHEIKQDASETPSAAETKLPAAVSHGGEHKNEQSLEQEVKLLRENKMKTEPTAARIDDDDEVEYDFNTKSTSQDQSNNVRAERMATPAELTDDKLNDKPVKSSRPPSTATTDEDSKTDTQCDNTESTAEASKIVDEPSTLQAQENTSESSGTTTAPLPLPSITPTADTDEDSSFTDISIITAKRDEKSASISKTERTHTRRTVSHDMTSKSTEDIDAAGGSNRAMKRSLLSVLNGLVSSKSAQTIQRALCDELSKEQYEKICYRRLDFSIVKKHIENGTIRNFVDLQHDLLQIACNVNFLFHESSAAYKASEVFKHEMQGIREFIVNGPELITKTEKEVKESKPASATKQVRTGFRKSQRIA